MMERILITGAGRGIGRAIACRLADHGRLLLLHGRDRKALEETARLADAKGASTLIVKSDLSTPAGVDAIVAAVGDQPLKVLVNNAGVAYVAPFENITLEQWQTTLAVNVTAPFLLMQRLLARLAPGAAIVNILSVAATTVFPQWSSYCMSKFALDGFTRAVREELRPRGIRVINIYPAATATGMWDGISGEWSAEAMMPPEEVAEAVAYGLSRPASVLVESIHVGHISGNQ
jgi:NAD(P)-dependent dehydrogenase (short-subunit alcohol dehydrogenase family)